MNLNNYIFTINVAGWRQIANQSWIVDVPVSLAGQVSNCSYTFPPQPKQCAFCILVKFEL